MDFEEFLSSSLAELLRFAVVLCGSRELGEDILHDVLPRAHQRWARVGAADSPYAYVRTMLVHEHLAWRRKWSRQIWSACRPAGHRARLPVPSSRSTLPA